MRLRLLLLGLILITLFAGTPYVAISDSSNYHASSASLRILWAADIAAGVPPDSLSPLQVELDAQSKSAFLGVPLLSLNPMRSQSEFDSLRDRTNTIYLTILDADRTQALAGRSALALALAPASTFQQHTWREELSAAITPNDYLTLAAAWQLDALLVPLDRSLTAKLQSLQTLLTQATGLQLSDPAASALINITLSYFNLEPTPRYAAAAPLLAQFPAVTTTLQSKIDAELARRAEAARIAAAAAAAAEAAAQARAQASAYLRLWLNGYYTDCSGATILPGGLYQDTCIPNTYLVAHKWSIGRFFFALHVGSQFYYQGHLYTVYNVYTITPSEEAWRVLNDSVPLTLQTCYTDSGSVLLIIWAH